MKFQVYASARRSKERKGRRKGILMALGKFRMRCTSCTAALALVTVGGRDHMTSFFFVYDAFVFVSYLHRTDSFSCLSGA